MSSLKEYFPLNPNVIFLNHGSFGAAPNRYLKRTKPGSFDSEDCLVAASLLLAATS